MKKQLQLSLIILFVSVQMVKAQNKFLYATATQGGPLGYGTILRSDSSGTNWQVVGNFNQVDGSAPQGKLTMAGNGLIYGNSIQGGYSDSCVIFTFNTVTNVITKIYDFMYYQYWGVIPYSSMILASDCNLYGLTNQGGGNGGGTLYSLDPSNNSYSDLYDFASASGDSPFGELLQLSNGKLYGLANSGGQNGGGVIFSFDPATYTYSVLHDFSNMTGANPAYGNLIQASNGKLYGMTQYGGTGGEGVIFSYDVATGIYADLHNFAFGTDGIDPFGTLVQANNGILYGMTIAGGANGDGVLFSYNITTSTYTILMDFNGLNGSTPQRGMTLTSTGKLFGTTKEGGLYNYGVIFSYDVTTNTYTKVLDFDNVTNGSYPTCDIFESGTPNPCITALPEINNQTAFSIYPNPAKNNEVVYINTEIKSGEIKIYDVAGAEIYSKEFKNLSGASSKQMGLKFHAGIYIVKVSDGENVFVKKLVVQ